MTSKVSPSSQSSPNSQSSQSLQAIQAPSSPSSKLSKLLKLPKLSKLSKLFKNFQLSKSPQPPKLSRLQKSKPIWVSCVAFKRKKEENIKNFFPLKQIPAVTKPSHMPHSRQLNSLLTQDSRLVESPKIPGT